MMAYGQDMPPTPHGPKILHRQLKVHQIPEDVDPLDDCKSDRNDIRSIDQFEFNERTNVLCCYIYYNYK